MDSSETQTTSPPLDLKFQDANGGEHSIRAALESGPVVLALYKSSCAASKVMLPMLQRVQNAHADDGLTTFGVAQDSANITRSFARRYGIEFPILIEGPEFPLSAGFGIRATPTIYVLRQDESTAYTTMGFLRDQIEEIESSVAGELGVPAQRIIAPEESDIPLFVPG